MTEQQKIAAFLETYRTYEMVLRECGSDYKSEEEQAEGLLGDRLRICRQMRNYLSHQQDAGFLAVSDGQLAFLQQQIRICRARLAKDTLGGNLQSLGSMACMPVESCMTVLRRMRRAHLYVLPVYDAREHGMKRLLGTVDAISLGMAVGANVRALVGSMKHGPMPNAIFAPDTPMQKVLSLHLSSCCCTSDGTSSGTLLGVWRAEEKDGR